MEETDSKGKRKRGVGWEEEEEERGWACRWKERQARREEWRKGEEKLEK